MFFYGEEENKGMQVDMFSVEVEATQWMRDQ